MNAKIIGHKLRDLRGKRSVQEVATAAGVSISSIFMYENGERIPRDEVKIKLARFFNVSIEYLFFTDKVHN